MLDFRLANWLIKSSCALYVLNRLMDFHEAENLFGISYPHELIIFSEKLV